jgi:hypothetical protein
MGWELLRTKVIQTALFPETLYSHKDGVQLSSCQWVAQLLEAGAQGSTPTVLAQDNACTHHMVWYECVM